MSPPVDKKDLTPTPAADDLGMKTNDGGTGKNFAWGRKLKSLGKASHYSCHQVATAPTGSGPPLYSNRLWAEIKMRLFPPMRLHPQALSRWSTQPAHRGKFLYFTEGGGGGRELTAHGLNWVHFSL